MRLLHPVAAAAAAATAVAAFLVCGSVAIKVIYSDGDELREGRSKKDRLPEEKEAVKKLRDEEEVACETYVDTLTRNGLGDNSFFVWPDGRVPYVIGSGFSAEHEANIREAVRDFNRVFAGCVRWEERSAGEPVYVEFLNSGGCYSKIGRAYWPFPLPQSISIGKCSHLVGHIKHEMLHTLGFYHEHSRSDRDMFVDIKWENIQDGRADQFDTYRWTTAYGEPYDYDSIMHYSALAFSKNPKSADPSSSLTIVPKGTDRVWTDIGRRANLSDVDVAKVKKMYKCEPYGDWKNECPGGDADCGFNEFCDSAGLNPFAAGQCRTLLADGSVCLSSTQCLHSCALGRCSGCVTDGDCSASADADSDYCAYKFVPFVQKYCSKFCGEGCLANFNCGGECSTCHWPSFVCVK